MTEDIKLVNLMPILFQNTKTLQFWLHLHGRYAF